MSTVERVLHTAQRVFREGSILKVIVKRGFNSPRDRLERILQLSRRPSREDSTVQLSRRPPRELSETGRVLYMLRSCLCQQQVAVLVIYVPGARA